MPDDGVRTVDSFDDGPVGIETATPAPPPRTDGAAKVEHTRFAHNSEHQFAKLLDFYGIAWDYEPSTFVLAWDREGRPVQAFSPDFFLPGYDLYIEITTLNQKLVTKKNRKVRRLAELHPEIKVKVLYQRDYVNLLMKYGLDAPAHVAHADASTARPASRAALPTKVIPTKVVGTKVVGTKVPPATVPPTGGPVSRGPHGGPGTVRAPGVRLDEAS